MVAPLSDCVSAAVADRIKQLRDEREWTNNRLATEAGVSPNTIHAIVHEQRETIEINTIAMICEACTITLEEFFSVGFSDIPIQE